MWICVYEFVGRIKLVLDLITLREITANPRASTEN